MVPYNCLVATFNFDGKLLTLHRPYYYSDHEGRLQKVPSGFQFNGSSIPRPVWTLLGESPMRGPHVHASVVHDYTYQTSSLDVTRKESDDLYYNMCVEHGMSKFKATVMWSCLRFFAMFHYKEREWNL